MEVRRTADPVAYAALVLPFLLADEARYNLEVGLVLRLAAGVTWGPEPPVLLSLHDAAGGVAGAALMTPPHNLLMAPWPRSGVAALAAHLRGTDLPGVAGEVATVESFARHRGRPATPGRSQGVYRLAAVVPPPALPPGALRLATEDDLPLYASWFDAFRAEVAIAEANRDHETARLRDGFVWFWDDGGPVSFVACSAYTRTGARVGPVYTPPEHRGRGYASAATAAVSQLLLDGGRAWCALYTDLANPTSNKIYQAIGYEHVADVQELLFTG